MTYLNFFNSLKFIGIGFFSQFPTLWQRANYTSSTVNYLRVRASKTWAEGRAKICFTVLRVWRIYDTIRARTWIAAFIEGYYLVQ